LKILHNIGPFFEALKPLSWVASSKRDLLAIHARLKEAQSRAEKDEE
jgi:hypothetical protein